MCQRDNNPTKDQKQSKATKSTHDKNENGELCYHCQIGQVSQDVRIKLLTVTGHLGAFNNKNESIISDWKPHIATRWQNVKQKIKPTAGYTTTTTE